MKPLAGKSWILAFVLFSFQAYIYTRWADFTIYLGLDLDKNLNDGLLFSLLAGAMITAATALLTFVYKGLKTKKVFEGYDRVLIILFMLLTPWLVFSFMHDPLWVTETSMPVGTALIYGLVHIIVYGSLSIRQSPVERHFEYRRTVVESANDEETLEIPTPWDLSRLSVIGILFFQIIVNYLAMHFGLYAVQTPNFNNVSDYTFLVPMLIALVSTSILTIIQYITVHWKEKRWVIEYGSRGEIVLQRTFGISYFNHTLYSIAVSIIGPVAGFWVLSIILSLSNQPVAVEYGIQPLLLYSGMGLANVVVFLLLGYLPARRRASKTTV